MRILTILVFVLLNSICLGQRWQTRTANISFHSAAKLEDITAVNRQGFINIDASAQTITAAVLMRGFEFRKALMKEHFNENYVESDLFPKAAFKGNFTGNAVQWDKDGEYITGVSGILSLHGVTGQIQCKAKITIRNGEISCTTDFPVTLSDYQIKIPKMVIENISKTVKITIITGTLNRIQ